MKSQRDAILIHLRAGSRVVDICNDLGVSRMSVYRAKKLFDAGQDAKCKKRPGRTRSATTKKAAASVIRSVRANPNRSIRKLAITSGRSRSTVQRIIKDAGFKSLRKQRIPLLSAKARQMRKERGQVLISDLKSAPPNRIVFFSDEKTFVVDPYHNRQNDRWIRLNPAAGAGDQSSDRYVTATKHPAAAMFLGVVASTGEVGPKIWYPQGFRLTADEYIVALRDKIVPWMRNVAAKHGRPGRPAKFVFQQDSAPAHKAKKNTQVFGGRKSAFLDPCNVATKLSRSGSSGLRNLAHDICCCLQDPCSQRRCDETPSWHCLGSSSTCQNPRSVLRIPPPFRAMCRC